MLETAINRHWYLSMCMRVLCVCLIGLGVMGSRPAAAAEAPVRVAIMPFTMHTPSDLQYLQGGIRSMLSSRLAWEGKVVVVDQGSVDQAVGSGKEVSRAKALQAGASVGADYVVYGSITALGQSISIDANMVPLKGSGEPITLATQTNSMDEVIPQINRFAQNINAKLFNRTAADGGGAGAPASNRSPEYLVSEIAPQEGSISYLNPNFVEITADSSLRQPGIWRSQTLPEGIIGMDVGDLDGDGKIELAALSTTKLTVYQRQGQALKTLGAYAAGGNTQFVWVALADVNGDRKDEICITAMITKSRAGDDNRDSVSSGSIRQELASIVLAMKQRQLSVLSDHQPFFLNTTTLGTQGKRLIGQRKGAYGDLFDPEIFEIHLQGNQLVPGAAVAVPRHCNVFNFVKVDLDNDQSDEIVLISSDNILRVLSSTGEQRWKGRQHFAATSNYMLGKVEDYRYNAIEHFYVPSPILVTDLNKDGIKEVIVNRSLDYSNFMPEGMKSYDAGEIVSLSWNQLGLVENWKSRELSGMVTSIRVAKLVEGGQPQLITSLVSGNDLSSFWKARSTVISYDLAVAPAKPPQAKTQ